MAALIFTKNQMFTIREFVSKYFIHLHKPFQKHPENLKAWFCQRRYPQKAVDAQFKRVSEKNLKDLYKKYMKIYL